MKPEIHPAYKPAIISCACGMSYPTHSTAGSYNVEICSACHPFFTGKQKLLDTEGRVDRFRRMFGMGQGQTTAAAVAAKKKAPAPKAAAPDAAAAPAA